MTSGHRSTDRVLLFTSLYPWPWQSTRAVFNQQQYRALEEELEVDYLIPVPFFLWFRYFPQLWHEMSRSQRVYFPFFYVPGVLRSWNLYFLALSIIVCVFPLIKLLRAKVVMASWAYPDAMACALLRPLCRFRLFIQCLGSDVNVHSRIPRHRKQLARGFRQSEAVITVSEALAREVRDIEPSTRAVTIYNGVNFERFQIAEDKPQGKRILFIGNLLDTKGVHELIEAFAALGEKEATLDLIGDGPARAALERRIGELGLTSLVVLHGRVPHEQLAKLLPRYSVLALPSYSEGVPNVVVEALACGVPVVTTPVGGIPEVVQGDCGILVPPRDVKALAEGLQTALAQPWDPQRLRNSISQLTWPANATQVAELIRVR
jgi:glycosyltransferase involved in cell wall biosynthesis